MQWYVKVLRQYVDFQGRARRTEYWMFTLVSVGISIVLAVLDTVLFGPAEQSTGWLGTLYAVATFLPALGVGVRRLHDTGRSGWWVLLGLIPSLVGIVVIGVIPSIGTIVLVGLVLLICAIALIVFLATDGNQGPNAYGPDPKAVSTPIG